MISEAPELWKPIPGHTGYEVSSHGRVRSWFGRDGGPRILTLKGRKQGRYLSVILGFRGPTREVHRLVGELFVPGQAPGLEVAHENGDKHDNRACNLRWKTRRENLVDKIRHGTHGRGITPEMVHDIRTSYKPGITTQQAIAERLGITQSAVSKVVRGQRWSHL